MKRLMAIDYGTRRIGIALSDMMRLIAQPYTILALTTRENLYNDIKHIVQDQDVDKIIVGLPLNMNGSESHASELCTAFAGELSEALSIPVEIWDERLTSVEAESILTQEAGMSRKKRKKIRDKLAACLILRSYLESHHNTV